MRGIHIQERHTEGIGKIRENSILLGRVRVQTLAVALGTRWRRVIQSWNNFGGSADGIANPGQAIGCASTKMEATLLGILCANPICDIMGLAWSLVVQILLPREVESSRLFYSVGSKIKSGKVHAFPESFWKRASCGGLAKWRGL